MSSPSYGLRLGLLCGALAAARPAPLIPQSERLTGVVLDVGCQSLPGVTLTVDREPSAVTDGNGRFSVAVAAERVLVGARLAGFRSVQRELHGAGASSERRLFMLIGPLNDVLRTSLEGQRVVYPGRPPEQPRLHGRVLDAQCRPLAGALVRVLPTVGERRTDADGRFEFASITSGAPDIEVLAAGFVTTTVKGVRIDDKNSGEVVVPMDEGPATERATVFDR